MENTETQIWISFAKHCGYISQERSESLLNEVKEVGKLIGFMIGNPEKFGSSKPKQT